MGKPQLLTLLVLAIFLIACAKTEVVKLDGKKETPSEDTPEEVIVPEQAEEAPKVPPQTTNATGKAVVKCEDTDGDDVYTSGRVTITYDDESQNDFIDECPVKNEFFQTEYTCVGNNVKSKTSICGSPCVVGICLD